ncbi:MAG: alpha/beta fold hydrolase [Burkholderiaceae bacterium]|nr:alpha/beta fold hydrolase [Burkholderiaceae bacterium]
MPTPPLFTALGSGPTVLLLHGLAGGHLAFAPQVETLAAAGWRAVAWDMPGYGRSAPTEPYTLKALADSCIALIDALRCGTVMVVGQGLGGMVALEVLARRPELIDRLVLSGVTPACAPEAARLMGEPLGLLDAGADMADAARQVVPRWIGPGSLPEGVRLAEHCLAGVHASTYRRAHDAMSGFDRRSLLAHLSVPTLLVAGEFDRVAPPAEVRAMAGAIAGSTFFELAGIGHLHNLEAPDEFDRLLQGFLRLPRVLH